MDRQDRSAAPESAAYLAHLAQQASHLDGQGFTVPAGAPAGVAPLVAALNDLVAHLRQEQADLAALNTALARARDDAAAASRAKSTFLANMSHELRTPLNAILGFTEMMLGGLYGPLAAEQEIRLTRILTNGQNLLALINEALDLTRIEAGKLHLHLVEIDPGPLLRTLVASVEPDLGRKQLELRVDVEPGLPRLRTDVDRLRQVLGNLLNNAIQFTERGGITLSVRRHPTRLGVLRFEVADTGIGIPAAALPHIWDEFYQVNPDRARPDGGSGLGLPLSRKLAEALGGAIAVASAEHAGSRFTVDLPLQPPE